jgi:hypothetical protein
MFDTIANLLERKSKTLARPPEAKGVPPARLQHPAGSQNQQQGFKKIFRWPVPNGPTPPPTRVEVVGSFSDWHKVPLAYDKPTKTWTATVSDIKNNHTHRYVYVVDGKPCYDSTCDGLAVPDDPVETEWQIQTPRGPRVMLMFSQTK